MNITISSKKKVKKLANRFTKHSTTLCKEHSPSGLPIDKPKCTSDLKSQHPSEKFEDIIQNEINKQSQYNLKEYQVKYKLRKIFKDEYYKNSDFRSCICCYNERLEDKNALSLRMNVPEKYDDISKL